MVQRPKRIREVYEGVDGNTAYALKDCGCDAERSRQGEI